MAFSTIYDPLTIDLRRQTNALLSILPSSSPYAADIIRASSTSGLLAILSRLLELPAFTQTIVMLFRPILFDLCARWLEDQENTEDQLVALCFLLGIHEELFPILYRLLSAPTFKEGPLAFIITTPSPLSLDTYRLQRLLLSYYRILRANRELPRDLVWSLSPLSILIWTPHLDNGVRLLAIRCYALQTGMGEAEREIMEREVLGTSCGVNCQLEFRQNIDGSREEVDGWIMPVIEMQRVKDNREEIVSKPYDYYTTNEGESPAHILPSELSPLVVNVHGVFLLRGSDYKQPLASPLISTPTAVQALQSITFHLSLRLPTLLTSPPSSGKSLLLSYLAGLLYPGVKNQVVTIHLADTSLDPRALLGSYVSSSTQPGTFEWKEGVLVRSMREGKWVVFKDIDKGNNEVLGIIKPLVESLGLGKWIGGHASLQIPSHGRVVASEGFALFATRSIHPSRTGTFTTPLFFGAHKFHEVVIPSPSQEELKTILNLRFPRLAGNTTLALLRLWESVKALGSVASTRDIGLRELEKFCIRIQRLLSSSHPSMDTSSDETSNIPSFASIFPNITLREDIYLEARDVFFGAGIVTTAARAHATTVASIIAEHLGLEAERRDWILHGRIPDFDLEKDVNGNTTAVRIGRTHIPARETRREIVPHPVRPFAMHKPAVLLLSRIATAVSLVEPILLTGETGTGKTSAITHLASLLRRPLVSLNLSHQTESSDLLGGFKPIDARIPGAILQQRFLDLFGGTFSRRKNEKFELEVRKAIGGGRWKRAVGLWKESSRLARERIQAKGAFELRDDAQAETPRKKRKIEQSEFNVSEASWLAFTHDVERFEVQHVQGKGKFAFDFVEGPLVKALKSGDWVLLDEINLASPETLECISGLLHGPTASITLTEQGLLEPVPRHPDFRLFACMNPATDVGKKDLPPNIRSRFTEIDVAPPDADKDTLLSIISQYIGAYAVGDKGVIMNVAEFYSAVKGLSERRQIADGSNHKPHFSIRSLARALMFASDTATMFGLRRAIWEGCMMAFTMVLDPSSAELVTTLAQKHLLAGVRNPRSMLMKEPQVPTSCSVDEYIKLGPFYLEKGSLPEDPAEDYIMTPSVETKLINLARIILTRRFPILIEGPTSSGKTSSVEYLAKRTGHRFIRINNHEHTDIQEYIGSYVSDPLTGKLVFKDGLLVRALRNGDWIVLDELNLAPTDVLEALNRLLDDNRELVIPETQEVVKPHPHFMLFATQNPPGLYAGRKVLSRAFRNRFLEVHFEDVPQVELETILCERCQIAPSYGKRIVHVFHELQKRRQSSRVFESKQGFATLRDLFRWAGRDAVGYQQLAENGYMLLAERTRRDDDKVVVKEVIESIMNVRIDENAMYNIHQPDINLGCPLPTSSDVIWTSAMQRLFILVASALRCNEPVLLVGETGCGKTSVCHIYAEAISQHLHSLNCHQNTETADLIGGLRPVRNRSTKEAEISQKATQLLQEFGIVEIPQSSDDFLSVFSSILKSDSKLAPEYKTCVQTLYNKLLQHQSIFEWHDGPLIEAMQNGDVFLLDEISLADDSVLERLNSVLEPDRIIVLAEKGGGDDVHPAIRAASGFKFVATMNPGGDYGKKELSPALRNRFTEIWVPRVDHRHDLELIVSSLWKYDALKPYTSHMLDFVEWFCARVGDHSLLSLRDIIAWVQFSNSAYKPEGPYCIPANEIFHHAAHMTLLDGLSSLPPLLAYSKDRLQQLKNDALSKLMDIVPLADNDVFFVPSYDSLTTTQFGSFAIPKGPGKATINNFNLHAPTTRENAMRVARACEVPKPILLEGSPGVGKTSLITAIANISGYDLRRINLSDQTDLTDLFGSDLPVEGGGPGEFSWKDAEFLKALQEGHWVLLDEMNLAPQTVLEGLNAILDHRGTVYIPELGRSFVRHPSFRIFAAQNPLSQGGGRKGLPRSFMNRFTKVYIEELSPSDLLMVGEHIFPDFDKAIIQNMISYNANLHAEVNILHKFGREGSPWEFNLRDIIRWGSLLLTTNQLLPPIEHLHTIYLHRFRTKQDQKKARLLFDRIFSLSTGLADLAPNLTISPAYIQIGYCTIERKNKVPSSPGGRILKMQLSTLESIGHCILQSWLAILTGQQNSGKTSAVRVLAHFTGNTLDEIPINSATDTMDILGSFEQTDLRRQALTLVDDVLSLLDDKLRSTSGSKGYQTQAHNLLWARGTSASYQTLLQMASELLPSMNHSSQAALQISSKIDTLLSMSDVVGCFEWVDGPLVRAMRLGHWLLMDDANLCNPSVLDRLNSLCEQDGLLTLSERGYVDGKVQVLKPHPNFRLFMTVNPQYGELSRAMRNRGIEISLIATPTADDLSILSDFYRIPSTLGDPKPQSVTFEAIRRGLLLKTPEVPSSLTSSGRSLDQESSLSGLVDQAPLVIISSLRSSRVTDAHLFFLAHTVTPAYIPHLMRFLIGSSKNLTTSLGRIRALLDSFPGQSLDTALTCFRESYSSMLSLPSSVVFSQPMDFYLTAPPCLDRKLDSNTPSAHLTIVRALNLATAIFLDEEDTNEIIALEKKAHSDKADKKMKALKEIAILLDIIHSAGHTILNFLAKDNHASNSEDANLASTLLGYGRHLRRIAAAGTFDFSALQAICRWVNDALQNCPSAFTTVATQTQALTNAISLSSGLGLIEIWSTWFVAKPSTALMPELESIKQYSLCLNGRNDADLRRRVFDFMAMWTLPVSGPGHTDSALLELKLDVENLLMRHSKTEEDASIAPPLLIAELSLFWELFHSDILVKFIQELIELTCSMHGPLLRIASYQHIIWSIQAGKGTIPIIAQAQTQWLKSLWFMSSSDDLLGGPSMLMQPTQLMTIVSACTGDSMHSLEKYAMEIRQHARLIYLQCTQPMPRLDKLANFFHQSIFLIASCFAPSFPALVYDTIHQWELQPAAGMITSMNKLLEQLELSTNAPFKLAVQKNLRPCLHLQNSSARKSIIANLGFCWVALGNLILDLFVPDTPVDPAAIQNYTIERWHQEKETLTLQLDLHRTLEELTTGNSHNEFIGYLGSTLSYISQQLSNAPCLPVRKDVSRLHMFWSEVLQFREHVLAPSRIQELLVLLESRDENAVLREKVVQQSIAGFCQRLDTFYTEYADISSPLQLAFLYIRTGLRFVGYSGVSNLSANATSRAASALVAFPSVCSSAALCADFATAGLTSISPFRRLLLTISAILMERSVGVSTGTRMDILELTCEQALRLWLIDRAKENEMATQSLYRRTNLDHNSIGEAETEQQDFLALFPSFEDALEPLVQTSAQVPSEAPILVSHTEMWQFVTIHEELLDCSGIDNFSLAIKPFKDMRRSVLASLLSSNSASLLDTLDNESIWLQFSLLRDRLSELETAPTVGGNAYNFYADTNILEVKKAIVIVSALKTRLEVIIIDWPDQMVLQDLKSRCEIVLNFDLHSPIAKILSALEQLLLQTENWEIYSNRENTLKQNQQDLIGLIVEWRRLELSCWQGLLESESKKVAARVSEWWFRLYDATIRGPLDAWDQETSGNSQSLRNYLNTLIPLLDDFIRTSPLGEFHTRMRLLRSFELYLRQLCPHKLDGQRFALNRVGRILHATGYYYSLFSAQVSGYLSDQRGVLENEIRGFIKLASWRDINVHALKASAQRTHHQLYKIVKKFRDVLKQPISERLSPQFAGTAETKHLAFNMPALGSTTSLSFPDTEPTFTSSSHLNLNRAFIKYDSLVATRIRTFIHSKSAHIVDDLAVGIITNAKELAAVSISNDVSVERQGKQQKALLVRKRKAWSDLLKELKHAGFATSIKSELLRQNADTCWIREQPVMPTMLDPMMSSHKGESYFARLHGALPELRSSLSNHHSDLTTRELQRGITLLESGFSMGIDLRSRLAAALEKYQYLEKSLKRLQMLALSPKLLFSSSNLLEHVLSIEDTLCRLLGTLQEVLDGVDTYNALGPKIKIPDLFTQEIKDRCMSTALLRERLSLVIANAKSTSLCLLLEDEHQLLLEVLQHFSDTTADLRHWTQIHPSLAYLFYPVIQWLGAQEIPPLLPLETSIPLTDDFDTLINTFLITIQNLTVRCPESPPTLEEDTDQYIVKDYRVVRDFTHLLNIDAVISNLDNTLLHFTTHPERLRKNLQHLLPFLSVYITLVKDQLVVHSQWTDALFKLDFVLCSVMHTLSKEGFCKPPDVDEKGTGDDALETTDGVGLGEGSGTENVSKDIEDESQVEGLQGGDAQEQGERNNEGDPNAIEMSEDIGGEMEDVPEAESDGEAELDRESNLDPEERLGNLDPSDSSAVDEKLWGDEQSPGDGDQAEKMNKDHSKESSGESDIAAKEDKGESHPKESNQEKESAEKAPDAADELTPEDIEKDHSPNISGAPMDDYIQDANPLDLPDDMDLGDKMDPGREDLSENMECDDDAAGDDGLDEAEPQKDDSTSDDWRRDSQPSNDNLESMEQEQNMEVAKEISEAQEDDDIPDSENPEEDAREEGVARPDISAGEGKTSSGEARHPDHGESASDGQAGGSENAVNKITALDDAFENSDELPKIGLPPDAQNTDTQTTGSAATGSEEGQAPSQLDIQPSTNPLRSLGDAIKEIRRRFENIVGTDQRDVPHEKSGEVGAPSQVEYLHPDDADRDMQALGPAGEEQAAKLSELNLVDEDNEMDGTIPMDIDPPLDVQDHEQPPHNQFSYGEHTSIEQNEDLDGLLRTRSATDDLVLSLDTPKFRPDVDTEEDTEHIVEAQLRDWYALGLPDAGAEKIWRLYESLTHDLAHALCEQLRLILDPTLATRLKGDYRTGKRLNMKKIISYIASDYTKDKIWLRRTRPSQREYQVLIAIDDSRSMSESHSVHLAYQTLALVSKALTHLEAGDIAIAKFGETVDIVHGFNEGAFTDQSGVKVMSAFHFNQTATNVLSLMETSLKVLENARERRSMSSATAADLWQLEIIISDGICQDHEYLRSVLRKAEEQRVMVVFVIIDSLHTSNTLNSVSSKNGPAQGSILTMDRAEFKNIDGRMELQLQKYLDSFPFEYYVVLRDVEALPEVLAGTLKQFFERISEE